MKPSVTKIIAIASAMYAVSLHAEEKIPLEQPKQGDLATELRDQPDGVVRVKTNEDGSFKSLVVKATVEIEDILGAAKGKQLARKEAEIKCKRDLANWLQENCDFRATSKHPLTLATKNESAKDAAGNVIKIRNEQSAETKEFTEESTSTAQKILKGLIVLQSEVTAAKDPEYVLIMGLSQENIDQAAAVANALSKKGGAAGPAAGEEKRAPAGNDGPAPEIKTNPAAKGF